MLGPWLIRKTHLVGGAITILKHMKVNGKDDIPYKWKIKKFETTNQTPRDDVRMMGMFEAVLGL